MCRARRILSAAIVLSLLPVAALAQSSPAGIPSHLQTAVDLARGNQLEAAVAAFESTIRDHPQDAVARAWLADLLRRQDHFADARAQAMTALELDPCQAFAHAVLGDLQNPQYVGTESGADQAAARAHYLEAVACDSREGGAWMSLWSMAVRTGDGALERRALAQMDESGFWTPGVIEYNRWVLEGAPSQAVLLVSGDADTFPTLILQQRGVRPDVAVVNVAMLNLDEYQRLLAARHDLPLPSELKHPYRDDHDQWVTHANQVIDHWVGLARDGELARPLALALSVDAKRLAPLDQDDVALDGGHYRLRREGDAPQDIAAIRKQLERVDPRALRPPYASQWDHSPVRCSSSANLALNPLAVALQASQALLETDDLVGARELLRWAQRYRQEAEPPSALDSQLAELDARCAQREKERG